MDKGCVTKKPGEDMMKYKANQVNNTFDEKEKYVSNNWKWRELKQRIKWRALQNLEAGTCWRENMRQNKPWIRNAMKKPG